MKKIFLLFTLFTGLLFAEMEWTDYDDALEKAEKENKVVMVMLSREGCAGCEYMKDIVFMDTKILEQFNKDFIAVHIDIQQDFIPDGLTFIGTPTFHFIDKDEKRIDRIDGGVNAKDFANKLKVVVKAK